MIAASTSIADAVTLNLFQGPGGVQFDRPVTGANLSEWLADATGEVTREGTLKRVQGDEEGRNGLMVRREFAA